MHRSSSGQREEERERRALNHTRRERERGRGREGEREGGETKRGREGGEREREGGERGGERERKRERGVSTYFVTLDQKLAGITDKTKCLHWNCLSNALHDLAQPQGKLLSGEDRLTYSLSHTIAPSTFTQSHTQEHTLPSLPPNPHSLTHSELVRGRHARIVVFKFLVLPGILTNLYEHRKRGKEGEREVRIVKG